MSVDFDVVIVGAGAAGIAGALELRKTSLSFMILEATSHIGGRVWTDHEIFTPISVDLGASWIHSYRPNNPVYSIYHEVHADKQLSSDRQQDIWFQLDSNGQPLSLESLNQGKAICKELYTCLEEFGNDSISEEDRSIAEVIEEKYEQLVVPQTDVKYIVDSHLALIEQAEGSNLAQLSAKQWKRFDENTVADQWVSCGYGTMFEHLVEKYSLPIRLNTVVTHIDSNDSHRIAINTSIDNPPIFCHHVIITISLGCLKRNAIIFDPPLSSWKRAAIDQMGFGLLNKFILQFPKCFWDVSPAILWHVSNQQRGRFLFTACTSPPANILVVFAYGALAQKLETQTDSEILTQVMAFIRQVFPRVSVPDPIKFRFTRWGQDPFAYGSYSSYIVHSNQDTIKLLAKDTAAGRIHWAGEHANTKDNDDEWGTGGVHNAVLSGRRAAMVIVNQLCSSPSSSQL